MGRRRAGAILCLMSVCLAPAARALAQTGTPPAADGGVPSAPPPAPTIPREGSPVVAATGIGTVSGTVLDKSTGEPVIDAGVEVVDAKKSTRTDLDGRYTFKLPPGRYQIRIFAPGFQGVRIENVVVRAGEVVKGDAALALAGKGGGLVVEVTAQAKKSNEAAQLLKRQRAAVVSDTISAEQVKKSPGSNAGDVVQRAPAVTVKDEKFVYVRGLGERYSTALLNGSRLPSTDPSRRVVPLDLFPASFLDSLAVVKTYSADLPGDFTGGLVDLDLRDHPDQLEGAFGATIGGNTQSTFQRFQSYRGSSLDIFGLGKNFRDSPVALPDFSRGPGGTIDTGVYNKLPDRRQFSIARSFKDIWSVTNDSAPLNNGVSFSAGDKWGPLGAQIGGIYSNEYRQFDDGILRQLQPETTSGTTSTSPFLTDFRERQSRYLNRLGGVFTGDWQPSESHRVTLRSLVERNATDTVDLTHGPSLDTSTNYRITQLRYTVDQLGFGQLAGEHKLGPVALKWRSALSQTTEDEPDTRFDVRQSGAFITDSNGGTRLFTSLNEWLSDSALDLSIPFKIPTSEVGAPFDVPVRLAVGPAYSYRKRNYEQRRFQYLRPAVGFDFTAPTEDILAPSNIGPDGFALNEETRPRDQFSARQSIRGFYGLIDVGIIPDKLFLVAGARGEGSHIALRTFTDVGVPFNKGLDDTDPLPSVNLRWVLRPDMNLRAGWSQTVSRPEFRELSSAQYPAPRGSDSVQGNPFLIESHVTNVDARWEWFFSPLELASVSFFHKEFDNPIEQTVLPNTSSGTVISYANFKSATLTGFELEGRKDLGTLTDWLRYWSLQANFTYADSNVDRSASNVDCATADISHPLPPHCLSGSLQRVPRDLRTPSGPLFDQAPFIVNAAVEYAHPRWGTWRLLYYTSDARVVLVGKNPLTFPNRVEQRRDQLDAVAIVPLKEWLGQPLTAQLTVENLLNAPKVITQGQFVQQQNTAGVKFTFGLSWAF